jgi:magnesium chelatase family protein
LNKISGPIVDRIDLQIEMKALSFDERFAESSDSESAVMLAKVEAARARQRTRFAGTGVPCNAAIPGGRVFDYCQLTEDALAKLKTLVAGNNMSTRSMDRLAKVSRTIADLDESTCTEPRHVEKASTFLIGGLLRER